jgi:hypothetical protein
MFRAIGATAGYLPFIIRNALQQSAELKVAPDVAYHGSGGPSGRRVGRRQRLTCRPETPGYRRGGSGGIHTPKHLRGARYPRFKGKLPAVLTKQEVSWQWAHRMPGGILMSAWQVKMAMGKLASTVYLAFDPASGEDMSCMVAVGVGPDGKTVVHDVQYAP